jgi:hypothetical protein
MRVVCIRDVKHLAVRGEIVPVVGQVYTVRETLTFLNGTVGYRLAEIKNRVMWYNSIDGKVLAECCFDTRNFKRVTDISELQKLTKVRELENA